MDVATLGIGLFATLYGLYTLYLRKANPGAFGKLATMQKYWGEKAGLIVHLIAYSVVPVVFGLYALYLGANGISIFAR